MSPHTQARRKELGAYYTPISLSQVLTDWAIRSSKDTILEPSFGGCGFLESCLSSFKKIGLKNAIKNLYGADIDEYAFESLSQKLGSLIDIKDRHFIRSDFLKLRNNDFPISNFDIIIGNPPYISHHNMSVAQRATCSKAIENSPFLESSLGMNTSLWAYFVIHALSFMKDGGRTAWVLPSSILNTHYSKKLIDVYKVHFENVKVIKLDTRFFKEVGADEVSVILIGENFKDAGYQESNFSFYSASGVSDLSTYIFEKYTSKTSYHENYKYELLDKACLNNFLKFKSDSTTAILKEICSIRIGMVTGDNSTFVINSTKVSQHNLSSSHLRPVVARFNQLSGIIHTKARHDRLVNDDKKCLLVNPNSIKRKSTSIRKYLATVDKNTRKNNKTFPKRAKWYQPDDGKYPDAFFSYMTHEGPRIVLNVAKYNCTNSIHRIYFTKKLPAWKAKAISLSLFSSFSQLNAEIEGRSYGSGVLKLEPNSAGQISIFTDEKVLRDLYKDAMNIIKQIEAGFFEKATDLVDKSISRSLNIPIQVFNGFKTATKILRQDRYKGLRQ